MYSIQTLIYGVPLTGDISDLIAKWEDEDDPRWVDGDDGFCGFTSLYHGGGADYKQQAKTINLEPTPQQKEKAEAMVAELDSALRALCPPIGVYMIFSSS